MTFLTIFAPLSSFSLISFASPTKMGILGRSLWSRFTGRSSTRLGRRWLRFRVPTIWIPLSSRWLLILFLVPSMSFSPFSAVTLSLSLLVCRALSFSLFSFSTLLALFLWIVPSSSKSQVHLLQAASSSSSNIPNSPSSISSPVSCFSRFSPYWSDNGCSSGLFCAITGFMA